MSGGDWAAIIMSAAAILTAVGAFFKLRQEKAPTQADVAAKYQAIAALEAGNNTVLKHRIDELEKRQNEIEAVHSAELAAIRADLAEEREYNTRLEEHLDYLVDLMKTHGMQPAKVRPARKSRAAA